MGFKLKYRVNQRVRLCGKDETFVYNRGDCGKTGRITCIASGLYQVYKDHIYWLKLDIDSAYKDCMAPIKNVWLVREKDIEGISEQLLFDFMHD